jgi:beta-N-acetylhexosaminidase
LNLRSQTINPGSQSLSGLIMLPVFFGFSGTTLTDEERAFFAACNPAGYILFGRNIESRDQVRALNAALKDLAGDAQVPILVDQEGGRVARLRPPLSPEFPSARRFGDVFARDPQAAITAARINATAIGLDLLDLGFTVDCLPCIDVPVAGAHDIIGDRAYALDPVLVAILGKASLDGLHAGGICGVIKHIPGHGRAAADSHLELPTLATSRAELAQDFAPFRALADAPMAMTAHVVYTAIDADQCATHSAALIGDVIRTDIGFQGLLMSDDLGMKALASGSLDVKQDFAERARRSIAAGCDVALHCSGDMLEMQGVAAGLSDMTALAHMRRNRAMATPARHPQDQILALLTERDRLLA